MKVKIFIALIGLIVMGSCAQRTCPTYIKHTPQEEPAEIRS